MDWGLRIDKLLSREFIGTILVIVFASVALMKGKAEFWEYSTFVGAVLGYYQTNKAVKEVKMAGTEAKAGD